MESGTACCARDDGAQAAAAELARNILRFI
jgi:hypothetical protein